MWLMVGLEYVDFRHKPSPLKTLQFLVYRDFISTMFLTYTIF